MREIIKADRASAKQNASPLTKQLNEELDNMTLQDVACLPCENEAQQDHQDADEADKLKAIWTPLRPTIEEVEEHNLTHSPYRNLVYFLCQR